MSWDVPLEVAWCELHDDNAADCSCRLEAESMRDDRDEQWGLDRMRGVE